VNTDKPAPTYIESFDGADPALDQELLDLGNAALELMRKMRLAIDLGPNTPERRMAQMCQAFLLGKLYRVTRSMLTLVRHGQGQEATSLLREQYEFIVALLHYQKHEADATLFMASHPVMQLRMAERNLKSRVTPQEISDRTKSAAALKVEADAARKRFPALLKPCPGNGKCKNATPTHEHDWHVMKPKDMLRDLIGDWLKEHHTKERTTPTRQELIEQIDTITERIHFSHSHFLSQEKHGLPFALINNLAITGGQIDDVGAQVDDPNDLAYHIIGSVQPAIRDTAANNRITSFDEEIAEWDSHLQSCKDRLGISAPNPALTALRPS
jgi:hypothetical protein